MDLTNILPILGIPIVRGVAGWAENAFKDGKITKFEWAKLGETVVRVGVIAAGAFYGLSSMGLDISALGASAGAVVLDFILMAIKKKKK